jgi:glycosyltransferase involved in cell wall biosynthesis
LRVLLLANSIDKPGGAGRLEAYLAKALTLLSHECILVASNKPHYSNILHNDNIDACKIILVRKQDRTQAPHKNFEALRHFLVDNIIGRTLIERIIEKTRPDVIISSGGMPRFIVAKARRMDIRTIVYYHMIAPWYVEIRGFYRKYKWSDLSTLWFEFNTALGRLSSIDYEPWPYADHVIVNSKYMAYLARRYWNKEPDVLQPPIEVKNFITQPREKRGYEITSIGRLDPDKRYEDLIEAVRKSVILREKIRVRLAGFTGNLKYLLNILRLAKKYNIKIVVERDVSEKRKHEILSNSMVFVNLSRHEHFGINVVEAMASGTPVIVHKSGGPYFDIIDRGTYGLSYSAIEELQSNIEMLVKNSNIWNKYSQLSVVRAGHYDFELFKQKLTNILDKMI